MSRAKEAGRYKERKATIDSDRVRNLREQGMGATAIAREMEIERTSVYRLLRI